jgi:hypothetical protein
MLTIKLYSDTQDLLAQMPNSGLVICPGPKVADNFRALLHNSTDNGKLEVITMASFVSNSLRSLYPTQELNKKNKFALMMTLGWSFHKFYPTKSFSEFEYYFNLLTELRGITLDLELFTNTVQGLRSEDFGVVAKLWMTIDALNIVDEQKSYSLIGNLQQEKNLVFFAFNNFSGTQIDFLKNLAAGNEVIVCISTGVKGNLLTKSWPQWLGSDDLFAKNSFVHEAVTKNIFVYSKGSLNIALKQLPVKYKNILLTQKNPELLKILEVSVEKVFYKTPINLFKNSVEKIFEKNFLAYRADPLENIRDYKVVKLIEEIKVTWQEEIGEIDVNNSFVTELFKQMVILNLPRNYMSGEVNEKLEGKVFGLESLDFVDNIKNLLLVFDSQYQYPKLQKSLLPAEWEKPLRELSPINNGEVEYYSTFFKLRNLICKSDSIILIENEIFKDHPFWNDLALGNDKVKKTTIFTGVEKSKNKLVLPNAQKKTPRYTASALQAYLECPRKYFFNYIYKIPELLSDECSLSASEVGTLAHAGIAASFNNQQNIMPILKDIFNKQLREWNKKIAANKLEKFILEVVAYVSSGLVALNQIKEERPSANFEFEKEIAGGRADLIVEDENGVSIIDFKLSSSSIPNVKEFSELEKIQLLQYGASIDETKKLSSLGYICLKDSTKSLIFGEIPLAIGLKNTNINIAELINKFKSLREVLVEKIKTDTIFVADPRENSDCRYCPVGIICTRGSE